MQCSKFYYYTIYTLGNGSPVLVFSNAGNKRLANSWAKCNNSSLYPVGIKFPKGCFTSLIRRCADNNDPRILR